MLSCGAPGSSKPPHTHKPLLSPSKWICHQTQFDNDWTCINCWIETTFLTSFYHWFWEALKSTAKEIRLADFCCIPYPCTLPISSSLWLWVAQDEPHRMTHKYCSQKCRVGKHFCMCLYNVGRSTKKRKLAKCHVQILKSNAYEKNLDNSWNVFIIACTRLQVANMQFPNTPPTQKKKKEKKIK